MTSQATERSARLRKERAARAAARVTTPVSRELEAKDPLAKRRSGGDTRRVTSFVVAGIAAELLAALALTLLGSTDGHAMTIREEKVVFRVVEPPRVDEPTPAPEPVIPQKEPQKPVERLEKPQKKSSLAPDPIDVPPEPPKAEPERRIVGINLESTVKGGKGPAFAVGDTRMGATGSVAEKPKSSGSPGGGVPRAGNETADFVPSASAVFVKPKRLAEPKLPYPPLLKAQGVEGDVAVLIRIGADGTVGDVRVVKGSGVPELDAAAVSAAKREKFSPATRDGAPVEYTLKYTYRFRIVDA